MVDSRITENGYRTASRQWTTSSHLERPLDPENFFIESQPLRGWDRLHWVSDLLNFVARDCDYNKLTCMFNTADVDAIFAWKLSRDVLPTRSKFKRGLEAGKTCDLGGDESESSYHAVIQCPLAQDL